jgi:hypothetical protein
MRAAARERRFTAYGDLAKASSVEWSKVRRQVPHQLGQLSQSRMGAAGRC